MPGSPPRSVSTERPQRTVEILDREPGVFAFSAWQNITMFVWQGRAGLQAVRRLAEVTDPIYAAYPEGVSNIHILTAGIPLPGNEVRDELGKLMRSRAHQRACIGFVLEGGGFWASALRSLITGMRVLAPRSFELRIGGSVEEVANWLPGPHFKKTGRHVDSESIRAAIEETRTASIALEPPPLANAGE